MREPELVDELDPVAAAGADARRRPLAHTVHGQDRGLLPGTGKESARRVGLVMFGKYKTLPVGATQRLAHLPWQMQFLPEPHWHGLQEALEARRRVGKVRLDQSIEFQQGFVVKTHIVELRGGQPRLLETEGNGIRRERLVVLLPGEAFLLGCRHDLAVHHQRGSGVMVEGGDAQYCCHLSLVPDVAVGVACFRVSGPMQPVAGPTRPLPSSDPPIATRQYS